MAGSLLSRVFSRATEAVDHRVGWHRLPLPLGLVTLIGLRKTLRRENLYDTGALDVAAPPTPPGDGRRHLVTRTADGTFNDLTQPAMGSAGTRFGRNVPLKHTFPDPEPAVLTPNPRIVSRELLTRETFQPATTLNVLAAAWLQFMIRDWFSHGKSETENPWQVPLVEDDPWPEHPMRILRTRRDPTRPPGSNGSPPTYVNTETHWWDASQIYGSDAAYQAKVRSGEGGKLIVASDSQPPSTRWSPNTRRMCPASGPGWRCCTASSPWNTTRSATGFDPSTRPGPTTTSSTTPG